MQVPNHKYCADSAQPCLRVEQVIQTAPLETSLPDVSGSSRFVDGRGYGAGTVMSYFAAEHGMLGLFRLSRLCHAVWLIHCHYWP